MRDYLYFLFTDHAIFRALWSNTHLIAPDVWRSNHPTKRRLRKLQQKGVRHVLSLRGDTKNSPYRFEVENCAALDLDLTVIGLASRDASPRTRYLDLLDFFDQIDVPFLMHCKSGADRTSLAAAFYLIYKCNLPISKARQQLSPRYLHFKWTKTGILDFTLDAYERFASQNPDTDLRYWIEHIYDADALKSAYNAHRRQKGKSPIA